MTREDIIESLFLSIDDKKRPFESKVMREAIKLLKAEAPRLLTAEDFDEGESVPCWKEPKSPTRRHGWAVIVYGKWLADRDVARYWTARPTAEQMEATPWPGV